MGIAAKTALAQAHARRLINEFRNDESGATAIEYGLIVALIFLAIIAAMKSVGTSNNKMYNTIEATIADQIN